MRIDPEAVGAWEIETFMAGAYRLEVPKDGRPTARELAMPGDDRNGDPVELLAWGRFDELTGLGPGITVGQSMLLVLTTEIDRGTYATRVVGPVVHILEDRPRSWR